MLRKSWVTLLIVAFIVFAYFTGDEQNNSSGDNQQNTSNINAQNKSVGVITQNQQNAGNTLQNKESQIVFTTPKKPNFVEEKIINIFGNILTSEKGKDLVKKILTSNYNTGDNNPYNNNATTLIQEGRGANAVCGQNVKINYLVRSFNGKIIKNTKKDNKPAKFFLGNITDRALQDSIIGMKKGEIKLVVMSKPQVANKEHLNALKSYEIELLDLKPQLPDFVKNIQLYTDKNLTTKKVYLCGDTITLNYVIKNSQGQVIYRQNSVTFNIGDKSMPYVFNKVADGISNNSTRTVIMPSKSFLQNIDGINSSRIKIKNIVNSNATLVVTFMAS